jgi:hypothetical protein
MTTTAQPEMNREAWLQRGAEHLWPAIVAAGGTKPQSYRVSCGWPSSSALMRASSRRRTLGEAWHGGSEDNSREVFISPALANPVEVLDVLAHELVHAACEPGVGHGPVFAAICRKIGLTEGKPTQARAGEKMLEELAELAKRLGPYPHAKLDRTPTTKQRARLMKGECPDCGYVIRVTRTWIEVGMPTCPCGSVMESVEYEPSGEPLALEGSVLTYRTKDSRFTLRTTKTGRVAGQWIVTDHEAVATTRQVGEHELTEYAERWTIRRNREDALAFIEAIRSGELEWSAVVELEDDEDLDDDELELVEGADDDELEDVFGKLGDWTATDDDLFLSEDEEENPDHEDSVLSEDEEAEYVRLADLREESGRRKSLAIAGGIEGALD